MSLAYSKTFRDSQLTRIVLSPTLSQSVTALNRHMQSVPDALKSHLSSGAYVKAKTLDVCPLRLVFSLKEDLSQTLEAAKLG